MKTEILVLDFEEILRSADDRVIAYLKRKQSLTIGRVVDLSLRYSEHDLRRHA
jgi:hypothetical protein